MDQQEYPPGTVGYLAKGRAWGTRASDGAADETPENADAEDSAAAEQPAPAEPPEPVSPAESGDATDTAAPTGRGGCRTPTHSRP